MAKFRLLTAHQLRNNELKADVLLLGDKETEHLGDEKGVIVGDGTSYPIINATLEMAALDDEAEGMLERERERLMRNNASMNPVDQLPVVLALGRDDYDDRYLPGFPGVPRPQKEAL